MKKSQQRYKEDNTNNENLQLKNKHIFLKQGKEIY